MSTHAVTAGDRKPAAADLPLAAAAASDVRLAPSPGARFTYSGGSRPLAGYTIKRAIGRGGFGEVYYAVSDSGKEVALKLIRRNFDVELRGVAQCLNLKHPNLLGLYDIRAGEHDERWVVMEYAVGPSLEEVLAEHPDGLPRGEAVAWLRGIAAGVAYLHQCGLVHRDLKPGNIFCDGGLAKIGDYGLSKFISCSRHSGQTGSVGTVHYMAPEIAGGRYGKEIDIYALGVMFYEMLTGRVPFEGESVAEVLMKHLTAEPDLGRIEEPYRAIVRRALAKDPRERFASAAEMAAALPELPGATARVHDLPPVAAPLASAGDPRPAPAVIAAEVAPTGTQEIATEEGPARAADPVSRWVRQALARLAAAWRLNFSTPLKIVLILCAMWLLAALGWLLLPVASALAVGYGLYRAAWSIGRWSAGRSRSKASPGGTVARRADRHAVADPRAVVVTAPKGGGHALSPAVAARLPAGGAGWHRRPLTALIVKSRCERLAELAGSLLLSAIVVLVTTLVMILLRGEPPAPEQFAWLALVSLAGTWGVLLPAKMWEGTHGEPALRRFVMLIVGLGVGLAAWGLQQALWVSLPNEFTATPAFAVGNHVPAQSVAAAADPSTPHSLMAYLTYFGFLYLMIRWWRLADPLRTVRLSLWTTAVCVTGAVALYMFWPLPQRWELFPQPWGFLVAATIAIAVQLSSPWQGRLRAAY